MTPDAKNPQPEPGVLARQVASVTDAGLRGVATGVGAVRAGGVGPGDSHELSTHETDAGKVRSCQVAKEERGTGES